MNLLTGGSAVKPVRVHRRSAAAPSNTIRARAPSDLNIVVGVNIYEYTAIERVMEAINYITRVDIE